MKCTTIKAIEGHTIVKCDGPNPRADTYLAIDARGEPRALIALKPIGRDLVVDAISVKHESDKRKRLGTRMYELATELACQQGKRLVSDSERSLYAEAFWRKQQVKGRAMCVEKGKGKVFLHPTKDLTPAEQARLPRPGKWETWPCRRYGVTEPCAVTSLEGARRRRKRR